jgi:peptidoglycan/LPS O-acetylase OafA/YrhL
LSSPSPKYRPDVDGLRAIAVMLVLNFHAFPEAMPGGFIGVDVFFVISGFLITGIITRELELGRFSLVEFYNRRIRRIFPALIVVLSATLTLGWFWMLPSAFAQLGSDSFASAAFLANIALLLQSGYFDVESAKKPLLHLWSLGIEEQFYLFWPLLLMLAARFRMSIMAMAAMLGIASFLLNVALIGSNPIAAFYLPFTRAFELLIGAVLACGWMNVNTSSAASSRRAWTGVALIAVAAGILDSQRAFPGWWAVLPVAGSALLLSAPAAWVNRVVLASPPDRADQLPALSLALAAVGIRRDYQIRSADAAGTRIDTARERAAGLGDLPICRDTVPFRSPEPAQDVQPRGRHGDGRGCGYCRRLGARLRLPAAAGNPRDGQRADGELQVAVS